MAGKWGLLWSVGGNFNAIWFVGERALKETRTTPMIESLYHRLKLHPTQLTHLVNSDRNLVQDPTKTPTLLSRQWLSRTSTNRHRLLQTGQYWQGLSWIGIGLAWTKSHNNSTENIKVAFSSFFLSLSFDAEGISTSMVLKSNSYTHEYG